MFVLHLLFELFHSCPQHYSRFRLLFRLCVSATIVVAVEIVVILSVRHLLSTSGVTATSILSQPTDVTTLQAQVTHSESFQMILTSQLRHDRSNPRPRGHHSQSWRLFSPGRSWAVSYEKNNPDIYCIDAPEEGIEIEFWSDVILAGENSTITLDDVLQREFVPSEC